MGRDHYRRRLSVISSTASPRPAHEIGETECQRSGVCCWRRPCELHAGDVERLADHLGLSPRDVFRLHLVVDRDHGGYTLVPRRSQQVGGRFLTAEQTWDIDTACHFLVDGRCSVHDAKPTGGVQWTCSMSVAETDRLPVGRWTRHRRLDVAVPAEGHQLLTGLPDDW